MRPLQGNTSTTIITTTTTSLPAVVLRSRQDLQPHPTARFLAKGD